MAVKKKEPASKSQSTPDAHKANNPAVTAQQTKQQTKVKTRSEAAKAKSAKVQTISPQKQKADEGKEVKHTVANLPFWQQMLQVGEFLNEVRSEARKISWPERSQVIRETISVLFLVTLITFFVWSFDLVVGKFIFSPLEHWGHLYGIGGNS